MKKLTAFILIIFLLQSCEQLNQFLKDMNIETPRVKNVQTKITDITLKDVELVFNVFISNPYPVPIKSPKFKYSFQVEGTEFVSSDKPVNIELPAGGVGTLTIPVRMGYLDLFNTYKLLKDKSEASYKMDGTVIFSAMGNNFNLPVSHKGNFPILRAPQIQDIKYEMAKVSLSGASISASAYIKNRNTFNVGIQDIKYSLILGAINVGGLKVEAENDLKPQTRTKIKITGEIKARDSLTQLMMGKKPGKAKMELSGAIKTPYGPIKLD